MSQNITPLIAAMLRRAFYPHNPSEVEFRQTHISYIFLSGPYVYKVKKAVKFNFLDYSTLEKRRHFCEEEMRLNRRLAPNTYLGTVGIGRANGSFFLDEKNLADRQRVVEYAVKMNRSGKPNAQDSSFGRCGENDSHLGSCQEACRFS
jgi:aminoglycoside phosphotransferase family enzyme